MHKLFYKNGATVNAILWVTEKRNNFKWHVFQLELMIYEKHTMNTVVNLYQDEFLFWNRIDKGFEALKNHDLARVKIMTSSDQVIWKLYLNFYFV